MDASGSISDLKSSGSFLSGYLFKIKLFKILILFPFLSKILVKIFY